MDPFWLKNGVQKIPIKKPNKIIKNPEIANNKAEKLRDHIIKNFDEKIISNLFFKEIDL